MPISDTGTRAIPTQRAAAEPAVQVRDHDLLSLLLGAPAAGDAARWQMTGSGHWCGSGFLSALEGDGWRVVHAPPVNWLGAGVDHIVTGPGGVLTVTTRSLPKQLVWVCGAGVFVDGRPQPYVKRARQDAERTARRLGRRVGFPVPVSAVVAVVGGEVVVREAAPGVAIVEADALRRLQDDLPAVDLDAGQLDAVHAAAASRTTWS